MNKIILLGFVILLALSLFSIKGLAVSYNITNYTYAIMMANWTTVNLTVYSHDDTGTLNISAGGHGWDEATDGNITASISPAFLTMAADTYYEIQLNLSTDYYNVYLVNVTTNSSSKTNYSYVITLSGFDRSVMNRYVVQRPAGYANTNWAGGGEGEYVDGIYYSSFRMRPGQPGNNITIINSSSGIANWSQISSFTKAMNFESPATTFEETELFYAEGRWHFYWGYGYSGDKIGYDNNTDIYSINISDGVRPTTFDSQRGPEIFKKTRNDVNYADKWFTTANSWVHNSSNISSNGWDYWFNASDKDGFDGDGSAQTTSFGNTWVDNQTGLWIALYESVQHFNPNCDYGCIGLGVMIPWRNMSFQEVSGLTPLFVSTQRAGEHTFRFDDWNVWHEEVFWYAEEDESTVDGAFEFVVYTTADISSPPTYSKNVTNTTVTNELCEFSLEWTDDVGLSGYIFSTNNSGTWANATWLPTPINPEPPRNMTNVTNLSASIGSIVAWCFYVNDTTNNWNRTGCDAGNEFILTTTGDVTPPTYSNCHQNVTNNTGVAVDTLINFGCQWTDDYGLSNYTNSSMTNTSGSWTNSTWTGFIAGNWSNFTIKFPSEMGSNVTFRIYANDTADLENVYGTWYWYNTTPASMTPVEIHLALNGTEGNRGYTYPDVINATGWMVGGILGNLYRNGTAIYTYTYQETADSYAFVDYADWTDPLNVNDTNWNTYGTTSGATEYYYANYTIPTYALTSGNLIQMSVGSGATQLTANRTIPLDCASSSPIQIRAENDGVYTNFTCYNYSDSTWHELYYQTQERIYEEAVYWNQTTDNEIILLPAGIYNYSFNWSGNASHSANETWHIATVSASSTTCTLSLDPATPIDFGIQSKATCSCTNDAPANLYRNDSDVNAGENDVYINLPVGIWNYTCNHSDIVNFTASVDSAIYTVNQADNAINMWINGNLNQNVTITPLESVNVTIQQAFDQTNITLWRNNTLVNSSIGTVTYYLNASEDEGMYMFLGNASGNANYSANTTGLAFNLTVGFTLTVDVLDELTLADLTFNITLQNSTFSFTEYGTTLFAANVTNMPYGDVSIIVWAENYTQRNYYRYITVDSTESIIGYLLHDDEGHEVIAHVRSYSELTLGNASITITRLISDSWETIAQGRTDDSGSYLFFLDPTTIYSFSVFKQDYEIKVASIIPTLQTYIFYLVKDIVEKPSYWDFYRTLYSDCTFDNSTRALNCTWIDTSGHITNTSLTVTTMNATDMWTICANTSTNSLGSFYCHFGTPNNQTFFWNMWIDTSSDPSSIPVASGSWTDWTVGVALGLTGILISMIIIIFAGFIGVQTGSPIVTIIMTVLGTGVCMVLNFMSLGTSAFTILLGFALSGGVLIWKMRTGERT